MLFHLLVLNGVYRPGTEDRLRFTPVSASSTGEFQWLEQRFAERTGRSLERSGGLITHDRKPGQRHLRRLHPLSRRRPLGAYPTPQGGDAEDPAANVLLRGQNILGYRHSADVVENFVERAVANGVDVFRIFDAVNDLRNLETAIGAVLKQDRHTQGTMSYTVSPVHTFDLWIELSRAYRQFSRTGNAVARH